MFNQQIQSFTTRRILTDIQSKNIALLNNRFDVRSRFACGYVAFTLLKFLDSGANHDLKVEYKYVPLTYEKALEMAKNHFPSKRVTGYSHTSLEMVKFVLQTLPEGSCAMIACDYNPKYLSGRFLGGLVPKKWGHWFNLVFLDGRVQSVDAYSPTTHKRSTNASDYLDIYLHDNVQAVILIADKRRGVYLYDTQH